MVFKFKTAAKALLLVILCFISNAQAFNFKIPYSHYSDSEPLSSVLVDFARAQGFGAQVSEKVMGTLSGRFNAEDPNRFIEGMRAAFGVRYYILNDTVYFYDESEWTENIIKPSNLSTSALLSKLNQGGFISKDLPVSNKGGVLVVSGPASYINTITTMTSNYDSQPQEQMVMRVFKLKHAKADDTEVESMNKTIEIPGIASILRQMVSGVSNGGSPVVTQNKATVTKLRGTGLASLGKEEQHEANNIDLSNISAGPGIIADTRLNAVIINDFAYRMPYYAQVIADLDQPVKLVELHAAIVDVDINATKNLGINWSGARQSGNWNIGGGVGNSGNIWDGTAFPIPNTSGGVFSTVFNTRHSNFMATINALEENSQARTLGRPSVLTLDNIEATLEDTTTRYVSVSGYQDVDLFKVEAGTVLQVTPHIIEDPNGGAPFISMIVNIQSNQDANENVDVTTGVPPIKQTKINTRALVREGQSLLLGGYYVEYRQDSDEGIPGLKDVAVAGKLFGSEGGESFRRERLIVITPRVMDLGELQELPADLDNKEFVMSPTQDNYLKRAAKRTDSSGCSSNRASL